MPTISAPSPWLTQESHYDAMLDGFGRPLTDVMLQLRPTTVLDVGCGTGAFTIELARQLEPGSLVTGIDIDPRVVARARERAWDASAANATFVTGDAASYAFSGPFDALTSRFGAMLFADPVPALAHLRGALAHGGHFSFVSWREPSANVWFSLPLSVASRHLPPSPPASGRGAGSGSRAGSGSGPGAFAFADADRVQRILLAAGFTDIAVTGLDRAVCVGTDPDDAVAFYAASLGASLPDDVASRTAADLRSALEPYTSDDGVYLPASAWLVTARRGR